jgi:hypothetical protein
VAGYSGTPLTRKLGIGPGTSVLLDGAPARFDLGELPAGASIRRRPTSAPYDVIVCFCGDRARLAARWPVLHPMTTVAGALWIAWPRYTSGVRTDLNEATIRDFALANGRVDVKVCAMDAEWSALKHVIRKVDR